ncbi:hypothetical protein C8J57DRAFT_1555065 [Mycena rebaudengoi]|nr:hypothetical protein C8J57DRAFT_1555065 [Mycena rebaudengoi]
MFKLICVLVLLLLNFFAGTLDHEQLVKRVADVIPTYVVVNTPTYVFAKAPTYIYILSALLLNAVVLDQLIRATTNKRRIVFGLHISIQDHNHHRFKLRAFHRVPGGVKILDVRTSLPGLLVAGKQIAVSALARCVLVLAYWVLLVHTALAYFRSVLHALLRLGILVLPLARGSRRLIRAILRRLGSAFTAAILAGAEEPAARPDGRWAHFVWLTSNLASTDLAVCIVFWRTWGSLLHALASSIRGCWRALSSRVQALAAWCCKLRAVLPQDTPYEDPDEEDISGATLVNEHEDKEETRVLDAMYSHYDKPRSLTMSIALVSSSSATALGSSSATALGASEELVPKRAPLSSSTSSPPAFWAPGGCTVRLSAPPPALAPSAPTLSTSAPSFVPQAAIAFPPTATASVPQVARPPAPLASLPTCSSTPAWTPSKPPSFWSPGGCAIRIAAPPPPAPLRVSAAVFVPKVPILHIAPPKARPGAPAFWSPGGCEVKIVASA